MVSGLSRREVNGRLLPTAVKIVIAGGFGVGKTTMVGTVSETQPLRTEEILTDQGVGVDDVSGVERKTTTTVAMDFGRITMGEDYVLYLFGTPGQERFWFMWDEVALGALGAVVLADTRRLSDCFPSVDYFERRGTPFLVAVNCFEGSRRYDLEEIQMALNLGPNVPVMLCDARKLDSCKKVLIDLVLHAMKVRGVGDEEPVNA
ncbi:ATP/GTP-binding protein [Actinomadura barringtoniae]|uniref:ATP/GTP-binding protein n=1 Tax=Actinomadura barringtoniae TaxID=1427535 RepID=A0A939PF16_9ACTN|nr:ATP/GTP-binding protein [Actinomadura barringtoniae]MBO2451436.1 ATP/GTP-binding protein [Actinomadura barringtoniae]